MSKDKFQRFSYRNVQICFMKKYWFGASEQGKHTSSPSLFRSTLSFPQTLSLHFLDLQLTRIRIAKGGERERVLIFGAMENSTLSIKPVE